MRLPIDTEVRFPNLRYPDNYRVTSRKDEGYNCIAWAVDIAERRYWPPVEGVEDGYAWLPALPVEETPEAFIAFFTGFGYEVCENPDLEADFSKIALYVDSEGKVSHAARQLDSGHWTSKLGHLEDIEHYTLQAVESSGYGRASAILRRRRT